MSLFAQQARTVRFLSLFVASAGILSLIGLVFIYEASSVFAGEQKNDTAFYVKRQAKGLIIGLLVGALLSVVPLRVLRFSARYAFCGAAAMTLLPLIISRFALTVHGSTRWLTLGSGYAVQPSEFMKATLIPCVASYLVDGSGSTIRHSAVPLMRALAVAACAAIIFLLQPDFGQAALIMIATCCIGLITYQYPAHLFLLSIPLGVIAGTLIIIQPYRLKRIMTFLHPWNDPQGAGFQIIQSLIAIGSGGWCGRGITQSQQKYFYLPMQHTDFIFSIIAEETGFVGACCIIGLYLMFLFAGVQLSVRVRHTWASMIILGQTILISLQALMNLAVTTGTAPTKGIGLPFLSYGMSSLIAHCCMIGIVIACVRHQMNSATVVQENYYAMPALK